MKAVMRGDGQIGSEVIARQLDSCNLNGCENLQTYTFSRISYRLKYSSLLRPFFKISGDRAIRQVNSARHILKSGNELTKSNGGIYHHERLCVNFKKLG